MVNSVVSGVAYGLWNRAIQYTTPQFFLTAIVAIGLTTTIAYVGRSLVNRCTHNKGRIPKLWVGPPRGKNGQVLHFSPNKWCLAPLCEAKNARDGRFLSEKGHPQFGNAPHNKLNGDEVAEVLQAQAGFTIATDKKPVVATYGCGPCVGLGGYDQTNKIAFVVHFSNAEEVRKSGHLIFYNISELAKQKIETPIQLHLRGGIKGQSEAIIEAIKIWMGQRKDLPMKIVSEDVLNSLMSFGPNESLSTSLSIDSRTGAVSQYDPKTNSKSKEISERDIMSAVMSASRPKISLAYTPKL